MSSCPGRTLEAFVDDCLMRPTPERVERICKVLEPIREAIEIQIGGFDSEEQSWRDYRNGLWDAIMEAHPDMDKAIEAILQETKP